MNKHRWNQPLAFITNLVLILVPMLIGTYIVNYYKYKYNFCLLHDQGGEGIPRKYYQPAIFYH